MRGSLSSVLPGEMVVERVVARRSGGRRGRGRAAEKANLRGRPAIILVRASGGTCQLLRPGTEITDASYSIRRYRLAGRGWPGQIKKDVWSYLELQQGKTQLAGLLSRMLRSLIQGEKKKASKERAAEKK